MNNINVKQEDYFKCPDSKRDAFASLAFINQPKLHKTSEGGFNPSMP